MTGKAIFKSHGRNRTDFTTLAAWLNEGVQWSNETGTLRGAPVEPGISTGRLADHPREAQGFKMLDELRQIDYVVFSYNTPIAWHTKHGEWFAPEVKYSATTTQHQSRVRHAVVTAMGFSPQREVVS